MTETELEGSGDDDVSRLSRRIQLNLTVSSHDVSLTLERNDNIPDNVTVIVGRHGRLITTEINDVSDRVGLSLNIRYTYWLGSVVVGCRTCDREVASSTPGRCIAG